MYKTVMKSAIKVAGLSIIGLGLLTSNIQADSYPSKTINVVVGFGIGGSADRMTRTMSTFLSDEIGQRIKIVNKKGAGTQLQQIMY